MASLGQLMDSLADRPGVEAALLFGRDGLPIEHRSRVALDSEAAAALGATLMREAVRLGDAAGRGPAVTAVLEYERGLTLLTRLGDTDWLLLFTGPDADVGELLYDLRRHRLALTALL